MHGFTKGKWAHNVYIIKRHPEPWFNIKMLTYRYRKYHCGDKSVVRSSYLHNGNSYSGNISSLYWVLLSIKQKCVVQWYMYFFISGRENWQAKNNKWFSGTRIANQVYNVQWPHKIMHLIFWKVTLINITPVSRTMIVYHRAYLTENSFHNPHPACC